MEIKTHPAVWVVLAGAILWIGLRWFERAMIFAPMRIISAHPGTVGLAFEPLWLTTSDGQRLRGWWIAGPSAESPVLLCLHGNAGNLSTRTDKMKIFHDAGAAQLWLDWRGYGDSGGRPTEAGLYRDAQAAWTWLTTLKAVPPARIVLYGESLGSGPAVELAVRVFPAGLIIDSGFTSIRDMARLLLPRLPAFLISVRFDNLAKLPRATCPTLILHSPEDDIIPFEMAQRNLAASGAAKKTLVAMKGSHNEGFLETGRAYGASIHAFLDGVPKPPQQ